MNKIIAVDFDGTLCENQWPGIGRPNISLIEYLKREQNNGAKIILWTCREGINLLNATCYCSNFGLYFDAVNDNVVEASKLFGGNSRKVYADEYIDDKACTYFKLPFGEKSVTQEVNAIQYEFKFDPAAE